LRSRRGFTLIELLVVIAIVALLMAILMPTLQRVKRQAQGIGCQSNLKQWGLIFSMYANDHAGQFPGWVDAGGPWPEVLTALWPYHQDTNDLFICPTARRSRSGPLGGSDWRLGSTYSAWSLRNAVRRTRIDCSYGVNVWAQHIPESEGAAPDARYWQQIPARGAANVPLLADSVLWWACHAGIGDPPAVEDQWTDASLPCCMDRHQGFVHMILMDWSIRRVGVKQLWTLKWHREYDTSGRWTRAGGVQPGDWPDWMRRLRDY
jgi:prepilin-type N-terminal cleavage/methylation domain-containing protein